MSEDTTKGLKDSGSFEDRFDRMEFRITSLEEREYDTKPIWERVLAEISELRADLETRTESLRTDLRSEFQAGIDGLRTEMKAEFKTAIDSLRTEMKAEFVSVRHQLEHELRGVARKMNLLNETFFQIQADQRYVDRRLEHLETRVEGT